LQPLAAATGASVCQVAAKWLQVAASGCKWLTGQVAASGCKWLQVAASGCKWLQVADIWKIKMMHVCSLSGVFL